MRHSNPNLSNNIPVDRIDGVRIALEPFGDQFVSGKYLAWLRDEETSRYLVKGGASVTWNDMENFSTSMQESSCDYFFAILDLQSDQHIGNVRLGPIDWELGESGFGLMIGDANYRGKGIGREVMELIERVAFSLLGLARLKFPVVEENMVALKMYAKSGYRRAGFSGEEFRKDGRSLPVTMLVKDR